MQAIILKNKMQTIKYFRMTLSSSLLKSIDLYTESKERLKLTMTIGKCINLEILDLAIEDLFGFT